MKDFDFLKGLLIQIGVGILSTAVVVALGKFVFSVSRRAFGPIWLFSLPFVFFVIIIYFIWRFVTSRNKIICSSQKVDEVNREIKKYNKLFLLISIIASIVFIIIIYILVSLGVFKRVYITCYFMTALISALAMNSTMYFVMKTAITEKGGK